MPKRRTPPRKRQLRRSPDARALEWATSRLERCERQQETLTARLQALHAEIPRLRGIIAALGPTPTATAADYENLKKAVPMPNMIRKPRVVAGMDVSRFVNPRPSVPDPIAPDLDEDALLDIVDQNLGKGNTVLE